LVFSTLHTNDAAGAVTRLIDMNVEPYLIASTREAVLGQRLVRTICLNCKGALHAGRRHAERMDLKREPRRPAFSFYRCGLLEVQRHGYKGERAVRVSCASPTRSAT
jgi:type II secretory ATPase GspE/PulE/Tfp pilus assembly ATPase PilB-like protein